MCESKVCSRTAACDAMRTSRRFVRVAACQPEPNAVHLQQTASVWLLRRRCITRNKRNALPQVHVQILSLNCRQGLLQLPQQDSNARKTA
jgi:hypothetical protein